MFVSIMKACVSFIKAASQRVQDKMLVKSKRDVDLFNRILEDMKKLTEKPFVRFQTVLRVSEKAIEASNWSMADEIVKNIHGKVLLLKDSTETRFDAQVILTLYTQTLLKIASQAKSFEDFIQATRENVRRQVDSFRSDLNVDETIDLFADDLQNKLKNVPENGRGVLFRAFSVESQRSTSSRVQEAVESFREALISVNGRIQSASDALLESLDSLDNQVSCLRKQTSSELE